MTKKVFHLASCDIQILNLKVTRRQINGVSAYLPCRNESLSHTQISLNLIEKFRVTAYPRILVMFFFLALLRGDEMSKKHKVEPVPVCLLFTIISEKFYGTLSTLSLSVRLKAPIIFPRKFLIIQEGFQL